MTHSSWPLTWSFNEIGKPYQYPVQRSVKIQVGVRCTRCKMCGRWRWTSRTSIVELPRRLRYLLTEDNVGLWGSVEEKYSTK